MGDGGARRQDAEMRARWPDCIPDEQWEVYRRVITAVRSRGVRFVLGGAFGLATYTERWRNTKDLDFFILQQDRDAMVDLLTQTGLEDYFDQQEYDRGWIYRACAGDTIVDTIWMMANRRAPVDELWLSRAPEVEVRGEQLPIVPVEELIFAKIYILHRDRCDWTDVLNVLYARGPSLDWRHLLDRLGEDIRLLAGVVSVFAWLCPGRAAALPSWIWGRLHLPVPDDDGGPEIDQRRVDLIDTRPWFGPVLDDGPCLPPL